MRVLRRSCLRILIAVLVLLALDSSFLQTQNTTALMARHVNAAQQGCSESYSVGQYRLGPAAHTPVIGRARILWSLPSTSTQRIQ